MIATMLYKGKPSNSQESKPYFQFTNKCKQMKTPINSVKIFSKPKFSVYLLVYLLVYA